MVTESFVSPQHFSPAPVCIVTCTMTTKLRLNMLLQLTVFGLKYLVHQVSARGVMSLLTSSVVHQVAIAPKSAAKEPTSKASAAPALKTRSAALSAVV